ncbi:hypothetical protein PENCOP_c008G02625 [Penicillium coprophilum]|uniref:Uncharacterized protein n=1 Tax=Penicillium coprophilum TaxID=36646 RepID=A0A1V6UJJ2_9EURO|nr:hypothetical protein PENCOP_c008G02625 [Penicillium coprophilum]
MVDSILVALFRLARM